MSEFTKLAADYYKNGLSCSESVIKAANDSGIYRTENIDELHRITSMFSGGMSSGCLCGAVAASQIVLGCIYGRSIGENKTSHREIAGEFIQTFKEKRKVTCCKALSAPYKDNLSERKLNCLYIVEESSQILENLVNKYSKEEANA